MKSKAKITTPILAFVGLVILLARIIIFAQTDSNMGEIEEIVFPSTARNDVVRITIDTDLKSDDVIAFKSVNEEIEVLCDDKIIYELKSKKFPGFLSTGITWNLININESNIGKTIEIRRTLIYGGKSTDQVYYMGGMPALYERIIADDILEIVIVLLMGFVGLSTLFILYTKKGKLAEKKYLLALPAATGNIILWVLLQINILTLLIPTGIFWGSVRNIAMVLFPLMVTFFVTSFTDSKSEKLYKYTNIVNRAMFFIAMLVMIIDCKLWKYTTIAIWVMVFVNLLISLIITFKAVRRNGKLNYKLGSIIVVIFIVIVDIVNYGTAYNYSSISYIVVAIYLFTLLVREAWEVRVKVEKESVIAKYKKLATIDRLTGVKNKETARQEVNRAIKNSKYGVFFMIDLDNFKSINDNFGHAYGDKVLVEVADKINLMFRSDDVVGRIGGDEFIVFVKNYGGNGWLEGKASQLIRKIRKDYEKNGMVIQVSSSVGLALYPENGSDYDSLYKTADKAMYKVKKNTKNGFTMA